MNNSVAAPPLLLAVLVQVVAEACRYRLRAALYSQVDSTTNSTSHDQLAESQVLLGLLESTPRPPTTPLPRIHAFGHGYPDSCLVNLCVAMCKCASEPDCPLALPVVKLEGVQESNPFQDKIEHHLSQERDYDQDLDTNGVLRREVARVVAMIDDDIDLMNVQECTAIPGLESFYGCLRGFFFSDAPPMPLSNATECATLICGTVTISRTIHVCQ